MKHRNNNLPKPKLKTYNYKQIQDAFWAIYSESKNKLPPESEMLSFFHKFISKLDLVPQEIGPSMEKVKQAYWETFYRSDHSVFDNDLTNECTGLFWREFLYNLQRPSGKKNVQQNCR